MLACCGRPAAAAFCDPFPYIDPRYARETIAEICSLGVALATAIMTQTGSKPEQNLTESPPKAVIFLQQNFTSVVGISDVIRTSISALQRNVLRSNKGV